MSLYNYDDAGKYIHVVDVDLSTPYSGKFLRCIIFAFFADWHRTSKIKLREIYRIDADALCML